MTDSNKLKANHVQSTPSISKVTRTVEAIPETKTIDTDPTDADGGFINDTPDEENKEDEDEEMEGLTIDEYSNASKYVVSNHLPSACWFGKLSS